MINIKINYLQLNKSIIAFCALFCSLIALTVLIGWHTNQSNFVHIFPKSLPMVYNAAIGFLIIGATFNFYIFKQKKVVVILGFILGVIGLLTCLEYIFSINLGIDQLLMKNYIVGNMYYPGRMAPNVAISFTCASIVFVMMGWFTLTRTRIVIMIYVGSLIISMGLIALVGYLAEVPTAYGWGMFTQMAAHTAIGLILLGMGIIAIAYSEVFLAKININNWLPGFIAFAVLCATVLLWQLSNAKQDNYIHELTKNEASNIKNIILADIRERTNSLQSMTNRWANREKTPLDEWLDDANYYIKTQTGYRAIQWVDTALYIRWVAPPQGNQGHINTNLENEIQFTETVQDALANRAQFVSPVITTSDGNQSFFIFSPIFRDTLFKGFIIGVINPTEMLKASLANSSPNYGIMIFSDKQKLYGLRDADIGNSENWHQIIDIPLCGTTQWQAIVFPSQHLQELLASWLPNLTLIIGFILAVLLASLTRIIQIARRNIAKVTEAQSALIYANNRFNAIIESTNDLVSAIDLDFNIIGFNTTFKKAFRHIFNYKISIGDNLRKILNTNDRLQAKFIELWDKALQGEGFVVTESFNKEGEPHHHYEIHYSPIKDKDNHLIGASLIASDISKRLQDEINIKRTNEELAEGINELENYNQKVLSLNEITNILQACLTFEETLEPIKHYCKDILKIPIGIVFILNRKTDEFEVGVHWGEVLTSLKALKQKDCWALRRSQTYKVTDPESDLLCMHMESVSKLTSAYVCIPIVCQSEVVGLLHLETPITQINLLEGSSFALLQMLNEQLGACLTNLNLREILHLQSIHDVLTGLYNRRYLEEMVQQEIYRAQRNNTTFGIMMIDIDHFKKVNDEYGHKVGDEVLQALAHTFKAHIRRGDIACRWGGEEFILYLYETNLDTIVERSEELRRSIEDLKIVSKEVGVVMKITISIGLALYPRDGKSLSELVIAADHALYQAKETGRNKVVMYKP